MKILVLYYTQTGQILDILQQLTSVFEKDQVDFVSFNTQRVFPYPWNSATFFDAMPESHLKIAEPIQTIPDVDMDAYDLVILGYQPWFLAPSIPTTSLLKNEWAKCLKNKKVITVIGSRNMWLNAQEGIKEMLHNVGAQLVGNIVLEDKHGNMTSTLTIIRWLFKGQKQASGVLPEAGVSKTDIENVSKFGAIIKSKLETDSLNLLQDDLITAGAVILKTNLIILERRGVANFPKFAHKIIAKGGPGNTARKPLVNVFKNLLIVSIFVLSPITNAIGKLQSWLQRSKLKTEAVYFKSVSYTPNKM